MKKMNSLLISCSVWILSLALFLCPCISLAESVDVLPTESVESLPADQTASAPAPSDSSSLSPANPWEEMTEDQLKETAGVSFALPEGAENVSCSYMKDDHLSQILFSLGGIDFCARIKAAELRIGEMSNISGLHYNWAYLEPVSVGESAGTLRRVTDENDRQIQLILGYDFVPGFIHSLSATGESLKDLNLADVAEQLFLPADSSEVAADESTAKKPG